MLKSLFPVFLLMITICNAQVKGQVFNFEYQDYTLSGVLNMPEDSAPKGLVLIVHGAGKTNVVDWNMHGDVRAQLVTSGYAVYIWDKMGCGKSEGTFDYNQPVQSSADEAIAAIKTLQEKNIPGSEHIGLWGISRAGWICPLIIKDYKDITFWISVSGVDDKENFKYLLEQNLRIEGMPKDSIDLMASEWLKATKIQHSGGSFESAVKATPNLSKNAFILRFNGGPFKEADYYKYQKTFIKGELDETTGLPIVVKDFDSILLDIDCPVLALFGEKDMHVDWQKTKALYESTLSKNTDLTIKSFPDANHNLFKCKTGGFYEFQDNDLPRVRPEGFLEAIKDWLNNLE